MVSKPKPLYTKTPKEFSGDGLPWEWHRVKLSSGLEIRVRGMPPYLADAMLAKLPLPTPPQIEIVSELPGGGTTIREDYDNPEYKQKLSESLRERDKALNDFQLIWGVDFEPPEDELWKAEIKKYIPTIVWSTGQYAAKLDYLKYVVLSSMMDLVQVRKVIQNLAQPTKEEINDLEAAFRDKT